MGETCRRCEFIQEFPRLLIRHGAVRVRDAVLGNIWKEVIIAFQQAAQLLFKKLSPGMHMIVHVDFMNVLLVDVVCPVWTYGFH